MVGSGQVRGGESQWQGRVHVYDVCVCVREREKWGGGDAEADGEEKEERAAGRSACTASQRVSCLCVAALQGLSGYCQLAFSRPVFAYPQQ